MNTPLHDDELDARLADLATHTGPDEAALADLHGRLRPVNASAEPASLPRWVHASSLALAAVAALVALAQLQSLTAEDGDRPLHAWSATRLQASRHVGLVYQGEGFLRSGASGHDIRWDMGRLEVDVDPQKGVLLW